MNLNLQVLNVQTSTGTSKTGKAFQTAEVAYKNLADGKVQSKKITSYSPIYKNVAELAPGSNINVVSEKNGDFWEWTSVIPSAPGEQPVKSETPWGNKYATTNVKTNTYETPEERAKRQVYIVKQSSVSSAISLLTTGATSPPTLGAVLDVAQNIFNYVMGTPKLEDMKNDLPTDDDIPD